MVPDDPDEDAAPIWPAEGGTHPLPFPAGGLQRTAHEHLVRIPSGDVALEGLFTRPACAEGLVIVACGSGTGKSHRLRGLARGFQQICLATLVVDLLAPDERDVVLTDLWWSTGMPLLGERLAALTGAVGRAPSMQGLPIGYLGLNTCASAALAAAATPLRHLAALVCLGGRVDRSPVTLAAVRPPTLFLVGEQDVVALEAAERALMLMTNMRNLTVMPGISPRLEEHGAIERVVDLAGSWLLQHLRRAARADQPLPPARP